MFHIIHTVNNEFYEGMYEFTSIAEAEKWLTEIGATNWAIGALEMTPAQIISKINYCHEQIRLSRMFGTLQDVHQWEAELATWRKKLEEVTA